MNDKQPTSGNYESFYREFDSPEMRRFRRRAYGEDIGQHSWVTADELRADLPRLNLTPKTRLLDLGCGPGGPLTFLMERSGCHGTGIEISDAALRAAQARAKKLGVDQRLEVRQRDLNEPVPLPDRSFDAVISYDVVLHLRDRARLFAEVARLLVDGGRFLFTDTGALTGVASNEQLALRSMHGFTCFAAPGFNERALAESGLREVETEDRTGHVYKNARGRRQARLSHREAMEKLEGAEGFARHQAYLNAVADLSHNRSLSRVMYLARLQR